MNANLTLRRKFEQKFFVTPGCWIWTAAKDKDGYGSLQSGQKKEGSHRISYKLYKGEIPNGMHVLHKCDNPSCVNPDHLFIGTNNDNVADRERKGRGVRPIGESHGRAKLTTEDVLRIRNAQGRQKDIARQYNVCQATICNIKNNIVWRNV